MDQIELTGLIFFGTHGNNPEETSLGQRFGIDLILWLDLARAAVTDGLEDTVSYSGIYKLVRSEVEGPPSKLLEHLAGRLIGLIMEYDARIARVRVKVTKMSPPLKGSTTGQVSVTLERARV